MRAFHFNGGTRTKDKDELHKNIIGNLNDDRFIKQDIENNIYENYEMQSFCDDYVNQADDIILLTKHVVKSIDNMYKNQTIYVHVKIFCFIINLLFSCIFEIQKRKLLHKLFFYEQITNNKYITTNY